MAKATEKVAREEQRGINREATEWRMGANKRPPAAQSPFRAEIVHTNT